MTEEEGVSYARWRICAESLSARRSPALLPPFCWSPIPGTGWHSGCRLMAICRGVRALADEFGIVLILDEVMAGLAVPAAGCPSSKMAWCRIW